MTTQERINQSLDTPEGRKALAMAMVPVIRQALELNAMEKAGMLRSVKWDLTGMPMDLKREFLRLLPRGPFDLEGWRKFIPFMDYALSIYEVSS